MKLLSRVLIFSGAAILLAQAAPAEFRYDVRQFQLDNGLTVLLYENHTAPVISYYTFFKVGSRNERPGITGISHVLEHMMFNGAQKYGPKMFDLMLETNGGSSNAYTTNDMTVYFEDFSSDVLELVVDLESDRMAHLALDSQVLATELDIIKEERLVRSENDPGGIIYEELMATAYTAHPYGWPIIGWMADLEHISRPDCAAYVSTFYAPDNAVIVIAGDFDTAKTTALIKTHFAGIPAGPPAPTVVQDEPVQRGARRVTIEKPAQYCHFMRGFHVGDKNDSNLYALEIINQLLVSSESSRLYQTLVNDLQLAMGMYGGFDWGFDPSLFYFYIAAIPGVEAGSIETAFDSVLTDFITQGPSEEELTRAKNSLIADYYKGFKSNAGIAHKIGYYQILYGNWQAMYKYVDNIEKVTIEAVKQAAAKYFTVPNSTTVILIPEGGAS